MFGGFFTIIIDIALVAGIIYAIYAISRRTSTPYTDTGGGASVRRLFVYVLLLGALFVAASGLTGLIGRVISESDVRRASEMAGTLAMALVGVPVYALLARWTWRGLVTELGERNAFGYSFYVNVALLVSLTVTIVAALVQVFLFVDGDGYDGLLVAMFVVWGAVWAGHWYLWRSMRPGRGPTFHLLVGSGAGVVLTATGAAIAIYLAIEQVVGDGSDLVGGTGFGDDLVKATAVAAVGAAVWIWHWLVHGLTLPRTTSWLVYVILFGVTTGLIAAVVGGAIGLFLVLEWSFGDPAAATAARHFDELAAPAAVSVVGLAVWRYHRAVLGTASSRRRTEVDRIYDYLVSGVGLATVGVAITILIVAFFETAVATAAVRGGESGQSTLVGAVTALLIGLPLWLTAWFRVQRHVRTGAEGEVVSITRRMYLFSVFGVGAAVAFGASIRLLMVILQAMLGEGSSSLRDEIGLPVALLTTTGAMAAYHWTVYRAERQQVEKRPRREVLLVWAGVDGVEEIATRTHTRVAVLRRLDELAGAVEIDELVAAIDEAEGNRLLVTAGAAGVDVVPYE